MTTDQADGAAKIAAEFTALLREGRDVEAQERWSDAVISLEPGESPRKICEGRAAVLEKHAFWRANATVYGVSIDGPFVHGDQFALVFEIDCSFMGAPRATAREIALYTVKDGAIVEERFFSAAPDASGPDA